MLSRIRCLIPRRAFTVKRTAVIPTIGSFQPSSFGALQVRTFAKKGKNDNKKGGKGDKGGKEDKKEKSEPFELDMKQIRSKMEEIVTRFKDELNQGKMKLGTASPELIENIPVTLPTGGSKHIKGLAKVTAKNASTLSVNVFDQSLLKAIHEAIVNAKIDLYPVVEGKTLTVPVPK